MSDDILLYDMTHASEEATALASLPWLNNAAWFGPWGLVSVDRDRTARISLLPATVVAEAGPRHVSGKNHPGLLVEVVHLRNGPLLAGEFLFEHFLDAATAARQPRLMANTRRGDGGAGEERRVAWTDHLGAAINPEDILRPYCQAIHDFIASARPSPGGGPSAALHRLRRHQARGSIEAALLNSLPWPDPVTWYGPWGIWSDQHDLVARIALLPVEGMPLNTSNEHYPKGRQCPGLQVEIVHVRSGPLLSGSFLFQHFVAREFQAMAPRLISHTRSAPAKSGEERVLAWYDRSGTAIDPTALVSPCCRAIRGFIDAVRGDEEQEDDGHSSTRFFRRMGAIDPVRRDRPRQEEVVVEFGDE